MQADINMSHMPSAFLSMVLDAGSNPVSNSAAKASPTGAATSSSVLATDSDKKPLVPETELLPLGPVTQEKRSKAAVPSKPKRPFGMTTLAALRQRPQPAVLRQKEAKASAAKTQPLHTSQPALGQQASNETAAPSSAGADTSTVGAGNAADLALAEPSSASAPSSWNLAQPERAPQQADQSTAPANEPVAPGSEASAGDAGEATSPVYLPPKPQPKLNKKQRRAQKRDQAEVDDDLAGPSSSGAVDMAWPDAESAAPASSDEATLSESSPAQVTQASQTQRTQQDDFSQQLLHSAGSPQGSSTVWGTLATLPGASSDQMNNERFPPLSQTDSRSESAMSPAPISADYNESVQELSFAAVMAGTPMAASVGESSAQQTQLEDDMSATAESSRRAERAECFAESSRQAEVDVAQTQAGSSALTAVSASDGDASAAAAPDEPAVAAAPPMFGHRFAGRGPFQLSTELQMALSGKPKPGRAKAKADVPLPEPSADLILQRALMEKPKPRPRPRRPRVTPQSTGNVLGALHVFTSVKSK